MPFVHELTLRTRVHCTAAPKEVVHYRQSRPSSSYYRPCANTLLFALEYYIQGGLGAFVVAYFIAAIKFTVSIAHVDFTQYLNTPADGTVPKIPVDSLCAYITLFVG